MSFRCAKSAWLLVVMGLALAGVLGAMAQDSPPSRGRSIQFSDPKSTEVSSNLNQISSEKATLHSLEQDLKKPFELFNPAEDSGGVLRPPVQRSVVSPAQTKRMREQLEKRNEWIFLGPEDYEPGVTAEDMLNVPEVGADGELRKPRTALERYYDRLEKMRAANTNQAEGSDSIGLRERGVGQEASGESTVGDDKNSSDSALNDMEQTLKRLSKPDAVGTPASETAEPKTFSEFFGFARTDSPEKQQQASQEFKAQMEEFKQLLEGRSSGSPNASAGTLNFLPGPQTMPAPGGQSGGLGSLPKASSGSALNPLTPNSSSLAPLPSAPTLTPSPGLPGWQTPPPAQAPTRVTIPPSTFTLPQRKF